MERKDVTPKTRRNQRWLAKNPNYYRDWHRKNPTYAPWRSMVNRCTNPNTPGYARYGGRGITVHEEWRRSHRTFAEHIGPRPSMEHSIDRIDNNGNYEPGNVRWATRSEQQRNKNSRVSTQAVARIAELRASGTSWRQVAATLNVEDVPTPNNKQWYGLTVKEAAQRAGIEPQA